MISRQNGTPSKSKYARLARRYEQFKIADEAVDEGDASNVSIIELDSDHSPALNRPLARIGNTYIQTTPTRRSHVERKETNIQDKGVERKSADQSFKHGSDYNGFNESNRIKELEKDNKRLQEENNRLQDETGNLKIRTEQLKTRQANNLKQLEERLRAEAQEELKTVLRIALDSIKQRGPSVDLLSDSTNVEQQIISFFKT